MGAQIERMIGNPMSEIIPGLFIGTLLNSKDYKLMKCNNITHIVSIIDDKYDLWDLEGICYLRLNAHDKFEQDITQFFLQAINFIHQARLNNGNVLIHCKCGKSRSASIVIAYLMTCTNLSFNEAIAAVVGARKCVKVNCSFKLQLQLFEALYLNQARCLLLLYYGLPNLNDELICRQNIFRLGTKQIE